MVEESIIHEMNKTGKLRKDCTLRVRMSFATQEQLDLYNKTERLRDKLRSKEDLVGRAQSQAYSIGRIDKLSPEKTKKVSEDLILIFIVIRGAPSCHWCGDPPSVDDLADLGVDRLDPTKTYQSSFEAGEFRPCCWFCNALKSNLPIEIMFRTVKNIVDFQDRQISATDVIRPRKKQLAWQRFKNRGNKLNHPVKISEDEFFRLRDQPCHHCGIQDPNGGGIDRLYNGDSYDHNSVPSCAICNKAKANFQPEYFYNKCRKILEQLTKLNGCY